MRLCLAMLSLFAVLLLLLPLTSAANIHESPATLPSSDFDFVIVGAGAAGSVIVNRLTEDPNTSVLLIEAGPSNIGVIKSRPRFSFTRLTIGTSRRRPSLDSTAEASSIATRGHMLGGSTSVNFMAYTRGSSEEWDRYARFSRDPGWSWARIQKYIQKNELLTAPADHHNTSEQFSPAFHNTFGINSVSLPGFRHEFDARIIQNTREHPSRFPFNLDMNSGQHLGLGWIQSTINGGQRSSAATSYLGPSFMSRPNLHVLINTHVTRLIHTGVEKGKPAFRGVEFAQKEQGPRTNITASKEVILSAGAIGTPQILLLSGIGDAKHLTALGIKTIINNPSVGRNLSDHPLLTSAWYVNSTTTYDEITRNAAAAAQEIANWQATQTGPLVNSPLAHLMWSRVPHGSFSIKDPAAGRYTAHYEVIFANGWLRPEPIPATGNFITVVTGVTAPSSRGALTLNTSNPFDQPNINPNLLGSDFDLFVMKSAVRAARNFLKAKAWDGFVIREFEDLAAAKNNTQLELYIKNNSGTLFHPVGTASMSPKGAKFGVVDPNLVVKGIAGLRIVDASVFPYVPSAHAQALVYIVAERAADLIKASYA
ncbi:aryl-alcohol oxidase [Mycena rebaudengoi]|nr:aryl-alcohol oxidase [Mycena rebaudengoi]